MITTNSKELKLRKSNDVLVGVEVVDVGLTAAARSLISLARSGWMLRGVPSQLAETVAEHCFLSAYICLDVSSRVEGVDSVKAALYALIHDVGEAFIGDLVKSVSSAVSGIKEGIETSYVDKYVDNEFVRRLYRDYLDQRGLESKLARLCNYIATYLTGLEYRRLGYRVDDIIDNTLREINEMAKALKIEHVVNDFLSKYVD